MLHRNRSEAKTESSIPPSGVKYSALLENSTSTPPDLPRLKLRLTPAAERAVRNGHPWVYADRIKAQNREGVSGELAVLYDRDNRFLGAGFYDPLSPIRVRILHIGKPIQIDDDWLRARLTVAMSHRADAFTNEQTNGYRCVNGESDGLPGLVLDRYHATAVVKVYTGAWFSRLDAIRKWLREDGRFTNAALRLSRNIQQAAEALDFFDGQTLLGNIGASPIVFLENGKRFEADPIKGQKTGFFLDQRDNRELVGEKAAGADVLNVFSHAGGFSVYAAAGGARSTIDLDISRHALDGACRNFALNQDLAGVRNCHHETAQADAFAWLGEKSRGDRRYDVVIIDPPSFAMRQAERDGALASYRTLIEFGLRLVKKRGLLVVASCSAHVRADEFFALVRRVAERDRRDCRELLTTGHPVDHPATFPEAHYLKCSYVQVG
jgi:23S rRNA (cytosine1962-C5)-methyltransferase